MAQTSQNVLSDWPTKFPKAYQRQKDSTGSPSLKSKYPHSFKVPQKLREVCSILGPEEEMLKESLFGFPQRDVAYSADLLQGFIDVILTQSFPNPANGGPELNDKLTTLHALKQGQFSLIRCQSCPSRGVANMYCEICNSFLCETCTDNHRTLKCLQTHKMLALEELLYNPQLVFDRQENCSRHPSRELIKYCTKCKIPVCRDCIIVKHRDHNTDIVDISCETDKRLTELNEGVQESHVSSQNIEKSLSELRDKRICLRENVMKVLVRTNARFSELYELLVKKQVCILEDIGEQYLREERPIQSEMDELNRSMDESRAVVKKTSKFLESAESMKCLLFKPVFEDIRTVLMSTRTLVKREQKRDNNQPTVVDEKALDTFFKALMEAFVEVHYP